MISLSSQPQRHQGIEVFLDVDGTLMNDSAIITIFGNLKSKNYNKYMNLLNDEASLQTLLFETQNYIRPNLKLFFEKLHQMKQYFSPFIQFSIYTSNPCVDLYRQVLILLQKLWNVDVITSYQYTPGKIKYIESKSHFQQQCIVDNNNTIENQNLNKLIKIKTFSPREGINENVYNVFKNYLLDEFGRNKEQLFKQSIYSQVMNVQNDPQSGFYVDNELLGIFETLKEKVISTLNEFLPSNKCRFFQIQCCPEQLQQQQQQQKQIQNKLDREEKQQESSSSSMESDGLDIQININNEILVEN